MTQEEQAQWFAEEAPPLNQAELDAINALFPTYIFRRSKTREVWTSCCHRHETLKLGRSKAESDVLIEPHQRESKNRLDPPKSSVTCPFCGQWAIVKELGRTGNRDNLSRYRRAVVLRWHQGALWARAYDCAKYYRKAQGYSLTGDPECRLVGVYRFQPGLAEGTTRDWFWDCPFRSLDRQDGPLAKGRWKIRGLFNANAQYGVGYDVIGVEQIQQSPFRYCMAEEAQKKTDKFLQFLTACCFYPRQIEMLMKAGMLNVVFDLTERGVKHAAVIDWEEPNPAKAFSLDRQSMKAFLGTSRDIRILELYKRLKRRVPMAECGDWIAKDLNIQKTFSAARKWNLPPEKLIRYLNGNIGCAKYGGLSSLGTALLFWQDYLTAAEAMNYPLHRENVLLPRSLVSAHDEAAKSHRQKLEREEAARRQEEEAQAEKKYKKRQAALEKKYGFAMSGYVIRVPSGKEEILKEGRMLKHCVGGYADRHMSGAVTILFMRRAKEPDEPWLTIEMRGNTLVQIHGFKNEGCFSADGRFAPNPREVYREFLDTWLDWLKKGSKRDKKGNPKLPGKKGEAA